MKIENVKFDLDDIFVIPSILTPISSRSECEVRVRKDYKDPTILESLPLITSPMDTVICTKNLHKYVDLGIIGCMPRNTYLSKEQNEKFSGKYFQSFGLKEIEDEIENKTDNKNAFYKYPKVLIDVANGHMERVLRIVRYIKTHYPGISLMVGNVAHPLTYKNLALAGADYVRCSIGTGAGCTTAANVAINYPLGSLIYECSQIKKESQLKAKIVADGGIRDFSDIFKALVLGADYVMMGSVFNKSIESAGFNYLKLPIGRIRIRNYHLARTMWRWGLPVYKKYRGMSTKAVQRKWGKTKLVTAEGITKYQKVEYNLSQWVENFEDYLRSNMSYCGVKTLRDYIGKAEWVFTSERGRKRVEK